jgi:DNA-binding transcriptional LysR family regulator
MLAGGLAVFDELRQSVVRVRHLADPNSGVLRIGCTQPHALGFLPSVIERMRPDYPGIRFRVVEGDEKSYLRQRRIELGIARASSEGTHPDLHEEILFNDPLVIAAATSNPWAHRRKISLKDIYDGPWIFPFYDGHAGGLIMEGFRAQGLEPPLAHVTSYAVTLYLGLLATGSYFTITARSMLRLNAGRLPIKALPVPFRHRPSRIAIVTVRNRTLSPAAELFIKYAREAAKPLSKGGS